MPQYEVGYRGWNGRLTPVFGRWWIIAETGFRLVFRSMWVRRLLFLSWLPIFYWGTVFFFVENSDTIGRGAATDLRIDQITSQNPGWMEQSADEAIKNLDKLTEHAKRQRYLREISLRRILQVVPGGSKLSKALATEDTDLQRHAIWSFLLMTFFRYPQATMIIFLLGFVSPGLISRDMRSRAYLLYFSRPIGRIEYILGKLATPMVYLFLVTTLPALILYILGVSLSPDISVVLVTWDIPIRILLASIVLILPTAALSLMFSSLTQESRFASFAWFAVWLLGHGAWMAIWLGTGISTNADSLQEVVNHPTVNGWSFLSLYNNLGKVQSWIFGLDSFTNAIPAITILLLVTIFSFVILFRRVSAPIRI